MSIAKDVASAIHKSGLWGNVNPNTVLMLCYLAEAEGNHPAVVYRDYHILQGKPSKKAEAMLRDFAAAGGRVEWHRLDDDCADATFHHPSGTARITWDTDRARSAQLGSNANWKKYPRAMLRSRCVSEGVRTVCPSATSGLYETSEVADIIADDAPNPAERAEPKASGLDGPYASKEALKRAFGALLRDVRASGDDDTLTIAISTDEAKAIIEQCERDAPHLLEGGNPPEWKGLFAEIQAMRDGFKLEEARHDA